MSALMCGHCYRPATTTVYRRPPWRKLVGLPAEARFSCADCLGRHYRRSSRWRRGR